MDEPRGTAGFSVLRRFVQRAEQRAVQAQELCELCGTAISATHRHMLEVATREVLCTCYPCSLLFDSPAASEGRYRLIPQRRLFLRELQISEPQWASLRIPVELAFLFYSTPAGKMVAYYPSPMGPTESQLRLEVWEEIAAQTPLLREMEADVEALLVNRAEGAREYYLVPIDECYRLVGLLRTKWKGLSGGDEVWQAIRDFFGELQQQSASAVAWR